MYHILDNKPIYTTCTLLVTTYTDLSSHHSIYWYADIQKIREGTQ